MDSTFFYPVTLHRGNATGSLTANWVATLPANMSISDEQVAVLYSSEGKFPQGLYLSPANSSVWRFIIPYSAICVGIIYGSNINVYYAVTTADSGLPSSAKIWRNGVETDDPIFTVNDGSVFGALTAAATGGGTVNSVNGVSPDNTGNVVIGIPQIPGLAAALASAGSVKTVNTASPDVNGNVTVPVATNTVAGTVKGGGNVTIAGDGTLNAPTYSLPVASATVLGGVKQGANITIAGDGTISATAAPYTLPPATTSTLGGVIVKNGLTVDGSGNLNADVLSFNGRTGAITLILNDVTDVGGAPLTSPVFNGTPTAPTPVSGDNSTNIATTAFVTDAIAAGLTGSIAVFEFTATSGQTVFPATFTSGAVVEVFLNGDILFTADYSTNGGIGPVTLNTGATLDDEVKIIATSPFNVANVVPITGGSYTGVVEGVTAAPGDNSTQFATTAFVDNAISGISAGVTSFNTRVGAVTLQLADVTGVGGAPLASPTFTGVPAGPTATAGTSSTQLATTAFVATSYAPLASPALTGTPTAPTATAGTNTTQVATTAFVTTALASSGVTSFNTRTGAVTLLAADVTGVGGALLDSPTFTGVPAAPTATAGTNTTQIATTAFVTAAVAAGTAGVTSFNTRTGAVTLQLSDVTGVGGAPLASPTFTGVPAAPTATAGTNTTQVATTAFVGTALTLYAPLASPALTGTPTAPTASTGTNNTQLATTNYVYGATQGQTTIALTNANVTLSAAQYSNPAIKLTGTLTGSVTLTFPTTGNWNIYNATTGAFTVTLSNGSGATVVIPQANTLGIMSDVTAGILSSSSSGGAVTSVAGRTGAIVLAVADVSGAAPLASPTFTGVPAAPTATAGTNTTQIATTAFVATSFAPLASPALTGTPTAPTATAGTNTTQLATTAFVTAAVSGSGVSSFNTRTGAVTLLAADVTGVGGALLASPTFTGTPAAPTAAAGVNTTQLATTAFVYNATQATGSVALTNANVTLSAAQYGNAIIDFTGTLTGNVVITFPTTGQWTLYNGTTGAFTVTVSNGGGATFAIPQGATIEVISSGATTGMLASSTASPVRFQSPAYSYSVTALGSVSGTQTLNLGTASEFTMTITGATTIAFTNTLLSGTSEIVYIRFTNAGSAAITWPASTKFAGATAPTFTASGVDVVGVKYDTTTSTYMVFVVGLAVG